jgi:type I restriction enzyme, S subunit
MNTYPLYKDSDVEWIGEIPSDWRCLRGRFLFENKKIINKEFQCENLLSLTLFGVLNKDMESNEGLRPSNYKTYQIFEKDDLVFKLIDLENVKTSRVGLVHEKGIMSPVYIRIEPNKNSHPKYNYYYFYDLYKKEIFNFLGSGVRSSLSPSDLLEIEVPVPPLQEQQQISDYLKYKTSKIDTLIEKTQQKIELLKEQQTSLINTTVTKGLKPNVEMKESGIEWIGEIPSGWGTSKIKYETEIFGRIGYRGYTTEDIVDEGEGVITISPGNIKNDKFNMDDVTYLSFEKYYESPEIMIFSNDIIIVKTGSTIGKVSIIPKNTPEMTLNPQLIVLKNKKINSKYLYYQTTCRFIKDSFIVEQTGSTTPTISQEKINNFYILKPPPQEQQQIVDYLDKETLKIDKLVDIESKRIDLLKEYRQSIISEVVTGKVDVRDEVLV